MEVKLFLWNISRNGAEQKRTDAFSLLLDSFLHNIIFLLLVRNCAAAAGWLLAKLKLSALRPRLPAGPRRNPGLYAPCFLSVSQEGEAPTSNTNCSKGSLSTGSLLKQPLPYPPLYRWSMRELKRSGCLYLASITNVSPATDDLEPEPAFYLTVALHNKICNIIYNQNNDRQKCCKKLRT